AHPLDGGFLVFSGAGGKESLWTAREIQQTRLRARLAVLSACQTGLGQAHDAGVIGLARAFQLAGVPRVVMSLWSVYDDATAELMQAFARRLRTHAPAEALRQAMLEVRKRRPNPAEWAAFVIFGTPL
ncbi:MAG TPA: CHAT domain-containing protein, partial [Pyrinomonadaceae bacterium]